MSEQLVDITITGITRETAERLALIIADEFDEHDYVRAESVTIYMAGASPITYKIEVDS